MHSESRSFAAFGTGSKCALSDASHGIDYCVAKLKELLFLLTNEGVQFLLAMVQPKKQRSWRLSALQICPWRAARRLFCTRMSFRPGFPGAKLASWLPYSRLC